MNPDIIIIGGGMGGLTAGALFASDRKSVLLLEASHVVGGCSSSYSRKGHVYESGATTLIGFDAHQPLARLESMTGVRIPRERLDPSMTVHLAGRRIIRHEKRKPWIAEAVRHFGQAQEQERFWNAALDTADAVWELSERNPYFPPSTFRDALSLLRNHPAHALRLRYAFQSVADVMRDHGLTDPLFRRFVDEQLLISAQSTADQVPFLFGAPALCYTNTGNFVVPGGMIRMAETLSEHIESMQGIVKTKHRAVSIEQIEGGFRVTAANGTSFEAPVLVSNIPVWNMPDLLTGDAKRRYEALSKRYDDAWGAVTMGLVTDDPYAADLTLHHQIHVAEALPVTGSASVFVSFSPRGDLTRAPEGRRVLAVSTHTPTAPWFEDPTRYEDRKSEVADAILQSLTSSLPGFADATLLQSQSATPVSWEQWVYRKYGRVGGLPQSMGRMLWDWPPMTGILPGLYHCGDTTYPGQGIPGVALSGIHVYLRVKRTHFQ